MSECSEVPWISPSAPHHASVTRSDNDSSGEMLRWRSKFGCGRMACLRTWLFSAGKTHLAIAIARSCIRSGARGRFYNVVDLVNRLETETRTQAMRAGDSKAATMIKQPALATSPQSRPAPTTRALPSNLVVQRGQNWTPIRGQFERRLTFRSAFSLATSRRSCSISCCSGCRTEMWTSSAAYFLGHSL